MAKSVKEDSSRKMKYYKRNRFLGCFCFPGKSSEKKLIPVIIKSGSHRKKNRWLKLCRWSRSAIKILDGKTLPVDVNLLGKKNLTTEILKSSTDQKLASKVQSVAVTGKKTEIQVAHSDRESSKEAKYKKPINVIVHDNVASKKSDTHKNGVFSCRKKVAHAKTVDDPNSPRVRKKSGMTRSKSQPEISQLVTHMPPKPKKSAIVSNTIHDVKNHSKENKAEITTIRKKYDAVVGMSIIIVILVVMLLWGKLCAILCTAACFFLISRFGVKVTIDSNLAMKEGLDVNDNAKVYDKKKVVMEGLLARNHRKVVGFL